jgi:serine/threonine protein kinase
MDADPPSPPIQGDRKYRAGDLVGRKYELERLLGQGGMGSVWCARNLSLDSLVALKLLLPDGASDAEDGDRLLQEARAAARLGHRAIVRVFDFGHTEQGDPFIVMELLEGESLASALKSRSRLSAIKSVQTILPIVDALVAAHAEGIVHRDLKPENIFLAREARRIQPKVVDFGIAKVERGGFTRTLTRKGAVLGSPGYMSPEQARGLPEIDHRADIWAVCLVLYECMTGRSPFSGENYNALMRAIIEESATPITEYSAGDEALWAIIRRGLEKKPDARWPSMRELGTALSRWLLANGVEHDVSGDSLVGWTSASEAASSVPPPNDAAVDASLIRLRSETRRGQVGHLFAEARRKPARAAVWAAGGAALLGIVWWMSASSRPPPRPTAGSGGPSATVDANHSSTQLVAPAAPAGSAAPLETSPPAAPAPEEASAPARPTASGGRRTASNAREVRPQKAAPTVQPRRPVSPAGPAPDLKDPYGTAP